MTALASTEDFPATAQATYLNTASVALMFSGAQVAIDEWNRQVAERGTVFFDEVAEQEVFDPLHDAFARLVSATPNDIAVASSATEQLATIAWAVMPPAGTRVLTTGIVFPTTIYPFARVARHTGAEVVFVPGEDGYVEAEQLLEAIDDSTSVVCLSHVEFGSGQLYDLAAFAEKCHEHGALLVVDATQSAGAIEIDAPGSGVDVLITGGYKWLCGPFGASVMYVAPHLQKTLEPGLIGFRSNKDIWKLDVDYQDYPDSAHRFEFSTMAYGNAIGLAAAVDHLASIGVETIAAHNLALADRLLAGLDELGANVVSPRNAEERTSIVSARMPGIESAEVVKHLGAANIVVSPRRDLFRFSIHLYNSSDDIDVALESLRSLR